MGRFCVLEAPLHVSLDMCPRSRYGLVNVALEAPSGVFRSHVCVFLGASVLSSWSHTGVVRKHPFCPESVAVVYR